MVLELKAPEAASFSVLWPLWPTAISYAVSYLFIVITWLNQPSPYAVLRLSDTAIDVSQLRSPVPSLTPALCHRMVARLRRPLSCFYAGLFVCIDVADKIFEHQVWAGADHTQISPRMRRTARRRS